MPAIDPAQYMQAMQGMMQNPEFMAMAERLGSQMMQVRNASARCSSAELWRGGALSSAVALSAPRAAAQASASFAVTP